MEEKNTWDKVNQWGEELALLRTIIQKTELVETNKWGGEVYTINKRDFGNLWQLPNKKKLKSTDSKKLGL